MKPFVHYLTKLTTIMYKNVSRVRVTEYCWKLAKLPGVFEEFSRASTLHRTITEQIPCLKLVV